LAPVLTPFDEDLKPDAARFLQHCMNLLEEGCSALAIFGTTSEANSLSVDEREQLFDFLLENGVPASRLLPGTGCCALTDTVRLTRKATEAGCAGVLMLPPFYFKNVSEEGLYRSFAQVIERVPGARVYLYHIPQFTEVPIPIPAIQRLRKQFGESVAGIKDISGDFAYTRAVLKAVPGFEVFVGSEKLLLSNLREGGAGCITATANVNAAAIARAFRDRTEEAQAAIDGVRAAFDRLPLIPALKEALARRTGHPKWRLVRPPLVELPESMRPQVPD
jgi:4-hydroxy-tetrahydrodipicolinate synthase